MISKDEIAIVVLVGGKSSRMEYHDKYKLPYGNTTMAKHIINQFTDYCNIYIAANCSQVIDLPYPTVIDSYDAIGPLGGLHTALSLKSYKYYFIISCDMPGINKEIIENMYEMLIMNENSCIIAKNNDRIQPLFAIYQSDILQKIEEQINNKQYKLKELINCIDKVYVDFPNSYSNCFYNINTVKQYNEVHNTNVLFGERDEK